MNALLNRTFVAALLTVIAGGLTAAHILPREVSANHIDQAVTLLLGIATAYFHGHDAGTAAVKSTLGSLIANRPLLASLLTGGAAVLTGTGLLRHEVSSAHIATAATLIIAIGASFLHGQTNGTAAASADTPSA